MEKFCIDVLGAKVRYISDLPLLDYFIKNKDFMEFYNSKIISDNKNVEYTVEYHDTDNLNNPLTFEENKMIVNYPEHKINESIILYLGFHFLEKQFGEKGMCSCHSACIEKDGKATLIIGEAGAGKTSVAINLCSKYGYKLISNDMTLIGENNDEIFAYGGTKFINLRKMSVDQNMSFLSYLFDSNNKDAWTNKVSVMAKNIDIEENYDITLITNIIFVHVDNRDKFKVSNGDSWRNNFLLYQNVSSHIRGTAATFIDKKGYPIGYIPSFETKETYDLRMKLINLINISENYYYASGELESVIDFINQLYYVKIKELKRKV